VVQGVDQDILHLEQMETFQQLHQVKVIQVEQVVLNLEHMVEVAVVELAQPEVMDLQLLEVLVV
jgi:hypothetical protein